MTPDFCIPVSDPLVPWGAQAHKRAEDELEEARRQQGTAKESREASAEMVQRLEAEATSLRAQAEELRQRRAATQEEAAALAHTAASLDEAAAGAGGPLATAAAALSEACGAVLAHVRRVGGAPLAHRLGALRQLVEGLAAAAADATRRDELAELRRALAADTDGAFDVCALAAEAMRPWRMLEGTWTERLLADVAVLSAMERTALPALVGSVSSLEASHAAHGASQGLHALQPRCWW